MSVFRATVGIRGKEMEVILSQIEFNRKTDNKGRPVTSVLGGPIGFTISTIYWVLDTLGAFESHSPLPMQRKDPAMLPKDNLKIVLPVNYKPQPTLKRVYSPKQIYIHPMPPKHY